jgi:uncharacterized membrane protein
MEELIKPNWHVVLVHFPLALLVVGTFIEVFSFLGWRRSSFRASGRWMILLGAVAAVPTTFAGIYALSDVVPDGLDVMWATHPAAAQSIYDHVLWQSIATGAAMLLVVVWISLVERWRDRLGILFKLGLLMVVAMIISASWHGGEIVYAHGIGPESGHPTTLPTTFPTDPRGIERMAAGAFEPEQVHVTMAGFAIAMACVCIGLAIRAAQSPVVRVEDEAEHVQRIASAFSREPGQDARAALNDNYAVVDVPDRRPKPARFWVLTSLLVVFAVGGGLWTLSHNEGGTWDADQLWTAVKESGNDANEMPSITRRYAHVVTGVVILAGSVIMALLALVASRNKLLLLIFSVPLVLAMAIQVWLGILLVLDGPQGYVTKFNEVEPTAERAVAPAQVGSQGSGRPGS